MGTSELFVALDLETTGFGKSDRIVEIGAVFFDAESRTIAGELETLINPLRNIPEQASQIHGIRAADVSIAPTFEDIADELLRMLNGAQIVAHNADFDLRFLAQEFSRIGKEVQFNEVICTMSMTGQSLPVACEQISYDFSHHSALEDARASLAVWVAFEGIASHTQLFPAHALLNQTFRTVARSQVGLLALDRRKSVLSNLAIDLNQVGAERAYLGLLDAYLRDLQISDLEAYGLSEFASSTGIEPSREVELQQIYLNEIESAAMRDGIITEAEALFFNSIAKTLGFGNTLQPSERPSSLPAKGGLVCVTGTAMVDGTKFDKRTIADLLETNGYTFTDAISKKAGVVLLLQESDGSQSSKVAKAQAWGIPRMVIADFVRLVQA